MGQKTNPNILRLGKTKDWKSKYLEKKKMELSVYSFRHIELEKFISRLFVTNGLKIKTCKLYHSESSLNVYVDYYFITHLSRSAKKNKLITKTKFKPVKSEKFENQKEHLKKSVLKNQFYTEKVYNKTFINNDQIKKSYFLDQKTQKLELANAYQTYRESKQYTDLYTKNKNLFIKKIIKGLSLFTLKKQNIHLNLKQLNKEKSLLFTFSKTEKRKIAKNLTKLRRFQQNEFLKKGISQLYYFVTNTQSSSFLAEFIALHLKKIKRPSFFLRFLKTTLRFFINKKFSKFKRIQIKIKGRFNGAPRASNKFINVGKNIPALTITSKIDYGEATAYTLNGTFGVKVWTYST